MQETLEPGKGEAALKFSPHHQSTIVARSPEDVARAGVQVYPPSLNDVFGEGAGQRYCDAMGITYVPPEG